MRSWPSVNCRRTTGLWGDMMTLCDKSAAESLQRAASGKANMGGLKPLSVSRAALRRAVEEADWLGQEERAEAYRLELSFVERKIAMGGVWEPEW